LTLFRSERESAADLGPVFSHLFYLPNFASPDESLYQKSIESLVSEVERCSLLEIPHLVIHLGHHRGEGHDFGIKRCIEAVNQALRLDRSVNILLENTAETKASVGGSFNDLSQVREEMTDPNRVGVCFDTCHAFAAGYDLRDRKSVDRTLSQLDQAVGLQHVKLIHCNDARFPLGSGRDRHEAIGHGEIGKQGFSALLRDPRVCDIPCVLETPAASIDDDLNNLKTLRLLAKV